MRNDSFSRLLSNYLTQYLPGIRGLGTNTILSYRDMFKNLVIFYETVLEIKPEKIMFNNFNAENIRHFLNWLEAERNNSISTRNVRLASLHAFARFIERQSPENIQNMQEILLIPYKKSSSPIPIFLSPEAVKLLLNMPDPRLKTGRRDRVLLSLLYDSGARVQELCDLVVADVRLDSPATVKLTGKGRKTRIVPLISPMANLLRNYINEEGLAEPAYNRQPLFQNRSRNKFTRKGISYTLNKYFVQARLEYPTHFPDTISPHCLRHSKSMHLLQAGVNLIYIRDILGHADIKTTEIYARIDNEMKRKALEKASLGTVSDKLPVWQEDKKLLQWLKELGK